MAVNEEFNTPHSGGWNDYPNRVTKYIFWGDKKFRSKPGTVKAGQVLKAFTFLETDTTGKFIAHSGISEKAVVTFPTKVDTGETVIIAGLTFTAGTDATVSGEALAAAWADIPVGTGYAAANTLKAASLSAGIGSFTAGTLTGYYTASNPTAKTVLFVSTTPYAGVTDLTVTGTGDASSVAITAISDPQKPIAGVTMYDVDATSADVNVEVFAEAPFYADDDGRCALRWKIDTAVDKVGAVACTPYDTGCSGTSAASNLLKMKFVEGSEFELDFLGMSVGA